MDAVLDDTTAPTMERYRFVQTGPVGRPPRWQSAGEALHTEWTKLRTARFNWWLLAGAVVVTVAVSAVGDAVVTCTPRIASCQQDTTQLSLSGIGFGGQILIAVLAVLAISEEYETGMIRTTLTAMPRRTTVFAAKAVLLAGVATAVGAVSVGASILAGRLILPWSGFTIARGFAPLSLGNGATLRAALGSVLYLALIALLGLGIATALRNTAAAVGGTLGLLYLFPLLAEVAGSTTWQRRYEAIGPMPAGLAIQATKGLSTVPIQPWAGLGVLAAWAVGAMLIGWLVLQRRDA
ncbi:MAG: ABC transporter permease [Acidimicrobiales bacterium]